MEWHLFGDFFARFIVTVHPIWDRKYINLDNQYIINPLSIHAILNFSFFFVAFRSVLFRFVWFRFAFFVTFRFVSLHFVSNGFVSFGFVSFRFVSFGSSRFVRFRFYFVTHFTGTLIKRVSVTYKCYEMYAHWGKKVQLFVFWDRSRNGRHLINYRHCLRSLPNRPKKNEKFNMAWILRGFIIYWLSKFRIFKT
jgi:hypothetical protein